MDNQTPRFNVSQFVEVTNQVLDMAYPVVEIEGEVSSFKVNQGKFVFFDLKDETASVGCFMMVFNLRVPIEDGMKVIIRAQPKLTNWGKFSLTVQAIRPSGEGSLKKSFDLLKQKLEREGLFAAERKRTLPVLPRRIAVISSTQAAGYADFVAVLNARWGGLDVDVAHTQVQGAVAADQVIRALQYFNEQPELADVLVIIRGGGSADDLAVFNDEPLVRAIAASRIPVLTGIGHETDTSLADLAADYAAVTPTNAAQVVVPDRQAIISESRQQLRLVAHAAVRSFETIAAETKSQLDDLSARAFLRLDEVRQQVTHQQELIAAYDPAKVLRRGYAIIRGELRVGAELEIQTDEYDITAEVHHVKKR